jgi:hypothetical protein
MTARWRTPVLINHCLTAQKLQISTINDRVSAMLTFIQQQARRNPEVVFGDGKERTRDSPEIRAFCRKIAAEGIVLLKNRNSVLPISGKNAKKIAIVGPNAKEKIISGGGSAALKASYVVTPFDGLQDAAPEDVAITYSVGCYCASLSPKLSFPCRTKAYIYSLQVFADSGNELGYSRWKAWLAVHFLQSRQGREPPTGAHYRISLARYSSEAK